MTIHSSSNTHSLVLFVPSLLQLFLEDKTYTVIMYVMSSTMLWLPILLEASLTGKNMIFPCYRSRLIIWPRKTVSTVSPRNSPFMIYTQTESGASSRAHLFLLLSTAAPIYTVNSHRVSPESIGLPNCVPMMAFTAAGPPAQGQTSSSNGCCVS